LPDGAAVALMEEIDIWRSANLMIQQHGPNAIVEAAKRQIALLEKGDITGAAVWAQIALAIDKLMADKPASDEASH
jgi:hypothetical protein